MALVDIRVDLPAYSRSLSVRVDSSSSIVHIKQEIHRTCPGQPRPEGQRLIWRGRILDDNEKVLDLWDSGPRIVHLAVHPSAWSSPPPTISPPVPVHQSQSTRPHLSPPPPSITPRMDFLNLHQPLSRQPLAFIVYKHQQALSALCPTIPPPSDPDNTQTTRSNALQLLDRNGWIWPTILDEPFPTPSEGGLVYEHTYIQGQPYLQLTQNSKAHTPLQTHALSVLSSTFAILSIPLPPAPTAHPVQSRSPPIPPNVNQLLQQLGLPPLRAANHNAYNAIPNPNNRVMPDIREIPIRPLLAPLMMLIFRTTLLLYFVAPARKPIFGILILAWMLYEIWQPIRNGLRNGWGQNNQPQPNNVPDARQAQNHPQPNEPQMAAEPPAANAPVRPVAIGPPNLNTQAGALFERLANMNLEEEERIIHHTSGLPVEEPTTSQKAITFLGLLVTTLHPAIWNRRRVALRRREGAVRTETNMRNTVPPTDDDSQGEPTPAQPRTAQLQEELRAQFNRRPRWVQRYMERVVAEDWVDDSD